MNAYCSSLTTSRSIVPLEFVLDIGSFDRQHPSIRLQCFDEPPRSSPERLMSTFFECEGLVDRVAFENWLRRLLWDHALSTDIQPMEIVRLKGQLCVKNTDEVAGEPVVPWRYICQVVYETYECEPGPKWLENEPLVNRLLAVGLLGDHGVKWICTKLCCRIRTRGRSSARLVSKRMLAVAEAPLGFRRLFILSSHPCMNKNPNKLRIIVSNSLCTQ